MKPIAIFRHSLTEGPGYFATYLDRAGLPWTLIKIDEGEPVPQDADAYAGLVFMGGPMSVNDELPWIPQVLRLINAAVAKDVPVLGHCLGGQLMSKALGGAVSRAPVKEIGWGEVSVLDSPQATQWFGTAGARLPVFQWHGETFSIPPNASHVLSSAWCANQAFALGPHLGLQCHIEMDETLVRSWCDTGAREIARSQSPGVEAAQSILTDLPAKVQALHAVADAVYSRWTQNLAG